MYTENINSSFEACFMFHDGNNFPYSDVIIVCGASSSSQGRVMDIISLSPITVPRVVRCPPAKY